MPTDIEGQTDGAGQGGSGHAQWGRYAFLVHTKTDVDTTPIPLYSRTLAVVA